MAKNVEEIALVARDEASRVIQNVASELGDVGSALTRLTALASPAGIALAAIGLSVGGIVALGAGVSDAVEQLDNLSTATGVSTDNLQVFREQIKEAGKDPDALNQALRFLNRAIATQDPLLKQLGITSHDTFTAFMQLAQAFEGSHDSAKKNEIAFQLLGRGAGELVGILPQIAHGFDGMKSAMEASGGLMKGATLEAARALDAQLDTLGRNWQGVMTRITSFTVPWAAAIVGAFDDVWDAVFNHGRPDSLPEVERKISAVEAKIHEALARIQKLQAQPGFVGLYGGEHATENILQAQLNKLEAELAQLNEARAALNPKGAGATRVERENITGSVGDTLRNVVVDPDVIAAMKAREDRLKSLAAVARETGLTAAQVADALDKLEASAKSKAVIGLLFPDLAQKNKDLEEFNKRVVAITQTLQNIDPKSARALVHEMDDLAARKKALEVHDALFPDAKKAADDLAEINKQVADIGRTLRVDDQTAEAFFLRLDERARQKKAFELKAELHVLTPEDVANHWTQALQDMGDMGNVLNETYQGIFDSLASGFDSITQSIIDGTVTAASVMKSLMHGAIDAIIHELDRLAARKIVLALLKLFGGGAGGGTFLDQVVPEAALAPVPTPVPPTSLTAGTPAPATAATSPRPPAPVPPPTAVIAKPPVAAPVPPPAALRAPAKLPAPEALRLVMPPLPRLEKLALAVPAFPDVRLVHDLDQVFAHGIAGLAAAIPDTLRVATLLPDVARLIDVRIAQPAAERQAQPVASSAPTPPVTPAAAPSQTVQIFSYDLRDGVRELTSLGGVQRQARQQVSYLREA